MYQKILIMAIITFYETDIVVKAICVIIVAFGYGNFTFLLKKNDTKIKFRIKTGLMASYAMPYNNKKLNDLELT
jgi:hypothetical protein